MKRGFDVAATERQLREHGVVSLGTPLLFTPSTESTNDDALVASAAGARHGATFIANAQTAGRGRRGNEWYAPAGSCLLFSTLLRPELPSQRLPWLPLATGLAVREATQKLLTQTVQVKWPNDVVVGSKKLAGILVESRHEGSRPGAIIVGVGVNLELDAFPNDLTETATSLSLLGAEGHSREALLAQILKQLELRLTSLLRDGRAILDELSRHDALLGQAVRVDNQAGVARGFDAHGGLKLERDDGSLVALQSGHVQWGS